MPRTAPATAPAHGSGRAPGTQPRWWTELSLVLVVYVAYATGRLMARGDLSTAVDNGLAILYVEKLYRINAEHPLNRLFTDHASLGIPADFVYASLHYLVTPAILAWLFVRRPSHYRIARTWLLVSTLMGLVAFTLLPTSPPRLLDAGHGFVDTMAQYGSYGWWAGEASAPRGLGGLTNQYAAMPSLHVGWSLWSGVLLWRHGRTRLTKAAGAVYPLLTTFVVMGTANHYFLDAVAGAVVMALGLLLTRPALRVTDLTRARVHTWVRNRRWSSTHTGTATIVSGGCETSAGERIPRQPSRGGDCGNAATASAPVAATAEDSAPAAAC